MLEISSSESNPPNNLFMKYKYREETTISAIYLKKIWKTQMRLEILWNSVPFSTTMPTLKVLTRTVESTYTLTVLTI
jgi:hypothetical protein